MNVKELTKESLRYGKMLTDDMIEDKDGNHIRIRLIKYNEQIYYHKMINGKTSIEIITKRLSE